MRIVNKQEFLKLPEGILYSDFEPFSFSGLKIKGETWDSDFIYQDLIGNVDAPSSSDSFDVLYNANETGESFSLDFDCGCRDGLYDNDQLFAIYETEDVIGLINRLNML